MDIQVIERQLENVATSLAEAEKRMSDPAIVSDRRAMSELGREHNRLKKIKLVSDKWLDVRNQLEDARSLLEEDDEEMVDLARADIEELEPQLEKVFEELRIVLMPSEPEDARDAIVEIRAGTGGEEAGLFAGDLLRMYERFVERRKWKLETLSATPSEMGGFKEVIIAVRGDGAFGVMKFEGGVHRVQRVPSTESQGRVHTSAATVAVLPEAEEVDVTIAANEIRVDVYRSSGPGGQSVNTTDSAIRITHLETGLVVTCQDEKSQHKNKDKAMRVLRARLYERAIAEGQAKRAASRKDLIGSGDRSAKIKTYNYPQNRVTDHRINMTLYRLQEIMDGDLDEMMDAMRLADAEAKLADSMNE